jgi:hypothetical protein
VNAATPAPKDRRSTQPADDRSNDAGAYGLAIFEQHQELLRASAISPEVARARGYVSVDTKTRLEPVRFSPVQRRVPGLLIPVHGVTGEVVAHEYRPDVPRVTDRGRTVKYEKPAGSRNRLDVPPAVLPALTDPSVPLWFTEGARKVDAAVSAGIACVGIAGVYGWRCTDRDTGGKVALGDFEAIALNGREVVLAFDSDVTTKPEVREALRRFRTFLESRGARVLLCVLPGSNGKVGLDDFLGTGGTREALQSLAVPRLPDISGPLEPAGNGQSDSCSELSEGDGTGTLADVVRAFQDRLELTDPDPLHAMLGAKAALTLPGDPVWLLIIDGSSGGKTELVMPLDALPDVHLSATLTEAALLSGTSRKERAENATGGVLRQVGKRGVILMKDFTSVLSMQRDTRAQTLAAMREVHDGRWSRPVGTDGGQVLKWAGKCAVIAGCTEAWDTAHAVVSMMGDRFLCVRPEHKSREKFGKRAFAGAGGEIEVRAELADVVRALFNTPLVAPLPVPDVDLLVDVADLVTLARSPIQRDGRGELVLVLAPEMPGRFVKALAGLWGGLTALGCDQGTAWRVVTRVAFDSMPRIRRRVLEVLAAAGGSKETGPVRNEARLPLSTTKRALEDLHAHGVLEREETKGGPKGDYWSLTDFYLDVWKRGHAPLPDISGAVDRGNAPGDAEQLLRDMLGARVVGAEVLDDTPRPPDDPRWTSEPPETDPRRWRQCERCGLKTPWRLDGKPRCYPSCERTP